ncbi:MAG: hypothetical protein LBT26_04375 [Clostridiales Family XIII bacterium]|jgi:hypothetical protein|nr:hypothetical protein [Clostridiales Family XIII bacterium]
MILNKTKLTQARGYWEGTAEAVDAETANLVAAYKKDVCKGYRSLTLEQIDTQLGGTQFHVTRKYDGELAVIFWNGTDLFSLNSGGRVRMGLPCMEEAARCLQAAGISEAVLPAELHLDESAGRTRVFEVLAALADPKQHGQIRLAFFDVISLDGVTGQTSYAEIHRKLEELFAGALTCGPVRHVLTDSRANVRELFAAWVEEEGGEGLVVRSELPFIHKIKPRYSIDAVVVGFSEGVAERKGQVRSLLLAMMPEDGVYQIVGHAGGGFSEEQRNAFFTRLLPMKIDSAYIETDSNHVAFHMVRPEIVVEVKLSDVLYESTVGPIVNPLLQIENGAYVRVGATPGISIVFPAFERLREDKGPNQTDVRLSQLDEFAYKPAEEKQAAADVKASALLRRTVYKKDSGSKLMVQKFLVWKTNKSEHGYPEYVMAYTNFSSERKDPLSNDVRVSGDEEQILQIYDDFIEKNVKKGWVEV